MSALRKVMQQALEAMQSVNHANHSWACVEAITALSAALAQPDVPEGWVLVPVEPTHEMCDQGAQAIVQWENGCVWPDSWGDTYAKQYRKDAKKAYSAMLAAAPKGSTK